MVTITLDDNGALVLDREYAGIPDLRAAHALNLVSGAGDAFISGLALSLAAGAQAAAAGEIASAVASIVVQKDGLAACCMDELSPTWVETLSWLRIGQPFPNSYRVCGSRGERSSSPTGSLIFFIRPMSPILVRRNHLAISWSSA